MLEPLLKRHFGFDHFRQGQEEAIQAVLDGRDVVVVMPTGSGKSVCFQLPAMELPGVTLVISPLIALMKDQVDSLTRFGLPVTFINSTLHPREMEERLSRVKAGEIKLLYLAPERLKDPRFLKLLDEIELSMLAVDEAHCVSQWGHDFRPDYLHLHKITRKFPEARVMALTATATGRVRDDIVEHLGLGKQGRAAPEIFVHGFIRPNLHIAVTRCATHDDKLRRVLDVMDKWRFGIIYCSTRKQAERVVVKLKAKQVDVVLYHAGLSDREREKIQNQFILGKADVVVATNAFGMGVDRSDVRFVLHWDIPGSMEAYYQEIGRAGRDEAPSWCELLYNFADVRTQEFFLEGGNPSKETILELLGFYRRRCMRSPLALPADVIKEELVSTNNPMAIRTATWILERAECVQREEEPGSRTQAVLAYEKINDRKLAEQVLKAEAKAARDRQKLDAILEYSNQPRCRHAQILAYFGDPTDLGDSCKACDRCVMGAVKVPEVFPEETWVAVQKILSAVARLDGQYGRARIAELLKGSQSKGIKEAHLETHRCHGLLKEWTLASIVSAIDELLQDGCLAQTGREYPTLEITPRGKEAMFRKVQPRVEFVAAAAEADVGVDEDLLKALKSWRMKRCRIAHVKPFHILSNKTLEALAARKPTSEKELSAIPGIGPAKLEKFGPEILKMMKAATY
ncbi:RecQ family ATP-dependent DNA helicase [Kiritimatiellota bacterium B12222]|nr:RecQ family ATP-dependent DNA helicase [Kiritimatiellota bacterium B12222]